MYPSGKFCIVSYWMFFFSSRRRHTRLQGDWSSDVCSSDLNSVRSGSMQMWRMRADGSAPEQLTSDQYNNWFPHLSPDGQWIAFLSFMKDVAPGDHPFYKHVYLRVMSTRAGGGSARVVAYVYGGQGTINVPSWSPDSRRLAFVSNTDLRRLP